MTVSSGFGVARRMQAHSVNRVAAASGVSDLGVGNRRRIVDECGVESVEHRGIRAHMGEQGGNVPAAHRSQASASTSRAYSLSSRIPRP